MKIRKARKEDLPEIIKVLKASLGENELPLSEEIWNYKHRENPFGKSIVLVAEENNIIVGVRAFMRWEWRVGEKKYSVFRAVDTATHPDYQGRGIFKKLTLSAVSEAEKAGNHLIFNTPNDQSRPGYLKMGWKSVGKIPVSLSPVFRFWNWNKNAGYKITNSSSESEREKLCHRWNENLAKQGIIFTPKTSEFLQWRYEKNHLQGYEVFTNNNLYLAAYVKNRKKIKELRVAECIFLNEKGRNESKVVIRKMAAKFGVQFISFSPSKHFNDLMQINGDFGPILTIRKLNLSQAEENKFRNMMNWSYSLGDLELF